MKIEKNNKLKNKKKHNNIDKYAQTLMDSPHDNVIKILAFAKSPFTIITEYINYGNVKKYVESERVSIIDRICITLQASKGIQHLHKLNTIHSEMCNNLLMEFKNGIIIRNINDIRVVITDDDLDASLGSLKWMAPELIENHNTNTTLKTDIYAFGITILTFVLFIMYYYFIFIYSDCVYHGWIQSVFYVACYYVQKIYFFFLIALRNIVFFVSDVTDFENEG